MKRLVPLVLKRAYWRLGDHLRHQRRLWALRGDSVRCSVCGWRGARFLDTEYHEGVQCPNCKSDVRHRLLFASLRHLPGLLSTEVVKDRDLLHFAPERCVRDRLRRMARSYLSADLEAGDGVAVRLDLTAVGIRSASLDVVLAFDVLEHIPGDRAALREIYRVLRPGGVAFLSVPQRDNAAATYEDASIVEPAEREIAFGQGDHVRHYGLDFVERLQEAGFSVRTVDADTFGPQLSSREVLRPPKPNPLPQVSNHRRVFFCRKV